MDLMEALKISGSALSAQRTKINVISENLANCQTTRTAEGGPYRRKMVVLAQEPVDSFQSVLDGEKDQDMGVKVADIVEAPKDFKLVYDPSNPDANPKTGYVKMPDINILTEMADMMVAQRAYDASVTAMNSTKSMMLKALDIGQ